MSDILSVEFNSLPASVRERFVAITNGSAGPAPILSQKGSTKSKVVGLSVLLVLLAVAAIAAVVLDFGDYYSWMSIHGPLYVALLYVPVAFLLLYVLLTIATRLVVRSPFPFAPGRYLFPSDFVDARTGTLRIVPTRLLADFNGVHHHTNGRYTHTLLTFKFQGATEQFVVNGQEAAQAATNAFWGSQQAIAAAAQAQDWQRVASLDPFFECRRTGNWGQAGPAAAGGGPTVKSIPAFFRWRAAVAAVAALLLCPPIALARNFASDEAMFAAAKRNDSEAAYGAYLRNGWRHHEEAKLAQPIAALREAKEEGTVSAMRGVLKNYPGSSVEADARAALHALYEKTLADFRAKASTADSRVVPFMERLLYYMERNDTSTVRVVFSPPSSVALSAADAEFIRRYSGGGRIVEPISPYFDTKRSGARESAIVSQMNSAFAKIFPTDVLKLEYAGEGGGESRDPSIAIAYAVGPSGDAYSSDDGQRVFVGIDVGFDMVMAIPNDSGPFDFKLRVSPPDRFGYQYSPGDSQAEAAYNAMAQRAFDEFSTKLQAVFFRDAPAAPSSSL